ncbi:hypothetical protein [uncultured Cedecea sp.]|uniref:hypothetical protein n=1 Tax=uncultured Cedecea sp. TaxID=988762 RepID=UPI00260681EF|nr:hypothetical protein [uncultured Cedecea sp.]
MYHQIEDIAAFNYPEDNDSGIVATVRFIFDDHNRNISVNVCIERDMEASLAVIEQRLLEKAKSQLNELVSEI